MRSHDFRPSPDIGEGIHILVHYQDVGSLVDCMIQNYNA